MTSRSPTTGPSARSLRILLVEDSPGDRDLAVEMLHEALTDTVISCTATLAGALEAVRQHEFDVALLDLSLPDATGLQVLQALRVAAPELVAVVVVTGQDEDGVARLALEQGAQDYLVKDRLDGETLARAIRYAVSRAHAEREAGRSRTWAQSVLDAVESPTCAIDADGVIVAVNAAWTGFAVQNGGVPALCGVGADYLAACERAADPVARTLAADLRALLRTGEGRIELDYPCHAPDQQRWFSLRATPTAGRGAAVLTHVDVTALRQAHDRLDYAATHDQLTGLANRRLMLAELDRRLAALQEGRAVALVFLDLDHFKDVNDTWGHTAGDGVLVRIAAELTAAVREGDLVARHGGDEFVVLVDIAEGTDDVDALVERLHAATRQRIHLPDAADVDTTSSLGLVIGRAGAAGTGEELLRAVDDAMHEAKARGRGRVEVFTEELRERSAARAQLHRELAAAVEQDQFVLHFQPIVVPEVGGLHAAEALLRWQHPTRGLLMPDAFLDVAETTGLIVPIGGLVIAAACAHGRALHDAGLQLAITVNLSAKQLNDPGTEALIADALTSTGFPAHALILEVTETTMLDDTEAAMASMQAIKALGVQLAVDDFGTGYSSMAYIKRYPIDGLKIDRTFVRDLLSSSDDRAIVASTIKLAQDLDMWVIAEGVETPEQLAALREMGCELVQGFLFARPAPAEDLLQPHLLTARAMSGIPHPRDPRAAALNAEGVPRPQGLRCHPRSVARALATD